MKIVVCVKHVPDAAAEPSFTGDGTTDRAAVDSVLSELDEYAVEQALRIAEAQEGAEITFLTAGPESAKDALRKALAMGGDKAVHISAGSRKARESAMYPGTFARTAPKRPVPCPWVPIDVTASL